MGKCKFVKLNEETGKRAAMARKKATKQTKAQAEAIRKEKQKRLKEFQAWWS
tara:strand:- start:29 stop:184 length:156 start_codon:yes stop_codon:yes gene_type:complete